MEKGSNIEDYEVIKIKGKHGMIHLHVPKREATEEEIIELHRGIAEAVVEGHNNKAKRKATSK